MPVCRCGKCLNCAALKCAHTIQNNLDKLGKLPGVVGYGTKCTNKKSLKFCIIIDLDMNKSTPELRREIIGDNIDGYGIIFRHNTRVVQAC